MEDVSWPTWQSRQSIGGWSSPARLGRGVVDWGPEDFVETALTLPFGLSAWMRQCAVDPEDACAAIWLLRDSLVEVSGLHRASEPRPLVPADRKVAVINMTVYLDSLVARASRCARRGRQEDPRGCGGQPGVVPGITASGRRSKARSPGYKEPATW